MNLLPEPWWLPALLAAVLLIDAIASIKPPKFISDCLTGVGFPREWWWTLIAIKLLAVTGLIIGMWVPGVGLAATYGVFAYFICAAAAHLRARFTGVSFWMNCLGMLALSLLVLVFSFLL